ncbi:LuxR C-terminal-related transcriptional regulator [Gordonia hydrophobica]|uniref:LuxR C-terminal-related transcriptional regulator n=1 Tax=Gordonia hydrophobica TaxID=40516 RepID=A0ABZ2U2L1_9ACTN|nr:LuxR C-terminal-related transcriptional regulator [Gordonia hydrophobica]MBM7369002.1 putative ATPase/DNA-binding CsgD family transcriptional regulator [Gordonia hydrophobica]
MNADEWAEIHRCRAQGESISGIAGRLRMSRNTVKRALATTEPPNDHRRLKGSATDAVEDQIRELLIEQPSISIAEIGRIIGWDRSRTLLSRRVNALRVDDTAAGGTPTAGRATIPRPATSFVGRLDEIRDLRRLLGEHRLVSIVGSGGMGKTRLAVEAAEEFRRAFPEGVRFVEFSGLRSESLLAQTVCDALGLDVSETQGTSLDDLIVDHLHSRRMLLVLDNCEHLVEEIATLVDRLVEETANLRILITSREYLAVPGEYVFHLSPLPTGEHDSVGAAVELFTQRATATVDGFELTDANLAFVQRICRRLDGLPLAIELACTRLSVLSVRDLADLLDRHLSMLTVGSRRRTSRHRSLEATIDWSFDLCSADERLLWSRVSVFVGGFDLATAVEVCGDDSLDDAAIMEALSGLVAKSVISRFEHGGSGAHVRFRMLESIRAYGWGKAEKAERDAMTARLLDWSARAIVESADSWYGPEQLATITVVQDNRGNVRAALESAMSAPDDVALTTTATAALSRATFLWACGVSAREHRMWLTKALDLPHAPAAHKARMFGVLALLQTLQGDRESADFALQRARELAAREHDAETAAFATHTAGLRDFFAGDFDAARINLDAAESAYRSIGAPAALHATLAVHRGMLLSATLEVDAAEATFAAVYDDTEAVGELWFHSYATYGLGLVALLRGDPSSAATMADQALRGHRAFGDTIGMTLMSDLLGWALAEDGSSERAAVILGAATAMWASVGRQLYGSDHWNSLRASAIETARRDLGDTAFERAWDRGRAMSQTELLACLFDAEPDDEPCPPKVTQRRLGTVDDLSEREREVAEMVAEGLTNKQIAERLVLSHRTVEGHVEHILSKLHIGRRSMVAAVLDTVD